MSLDILAILADWKEDAVISETQINVEICRTPALHSKYLSFFVELKRELSVAESQFYRLGNIKRRYYRGECTQEELKKFNWIQFQGLKPGLSEMNAYLDYDIDLIKLREKISDLKTSCSSIEYVMKSIAGRDYSIKTLVEYNKYISGN
jgi:hypothetical protein